MKPWLLRLTFCCLGMFVFGLLMIGVGIWSLFSWLSTGYNNDGKKVTFHTFNNATWRVDRRELKLADPETFRTFRGAGGKYGNDERNVYFESQHIVEADADTFEVLDWRQGFSRDQSRAYYRRLPISNDPENFRVLTQSYSKDQQRVYYLHHVIEGADPSTFAVTSDVTSKASDKHGEYYGKDRKD